MFKRKQFLTMVVAASVCLTGIPAANATSVNEVAYGANSEAASTVVSRTVTHEGEETTETVVLASGDTFVSVFNEESRMLTGYFNGVYVNSINIDDTYANFEWTVKSYRSRCDIIDWLQYGNGALWAIASGLFPPSALAAIAAGTATSGIILAAKQACKAKFG